MLKNNLRVAISKSGMIIKEIADKSGVKKRTIDKWIGIEETEPKVNDLFRVCRAIGITIEWAVAGEFGTEYVRKIISNDPNALQVPDRILPIVKNLLLLDDKNLKGIQANVEALTTDNHNTASRPPAQSRAQ